MLCVPLRAASLKKGGTHNPMPPRALVFIEVAMNKAWHVADPMPPKARRDQRVR
jgi:hypothetical protein